MAAQLDAAAESREAKVMRRLAGALDDYGLSTIGKSVAMAYLRKLPEDDMARVRAWWLRKLNGSDLVPPDATPARQRGCPELFEGLRAQPVWWRGCEETRSEFPTELAWVADVERNAPAMREELLRLRDQGEEHFQPYRAPSSEQEGGRGATDRGDWNVFYLELHNMDFEAHRERCPVTCGVLERIPQTYGHAFFSSTACNTHITDHNGPTAKKLRCHLPLLCPAEGCRIRVGDEMVRMARDRAIIFDDSFNHEAWNDHPSEARIALIFDVWHPDLSAREVKFLSFLQTAAMKRAKRVCEAAGVRGDTFYSVIDQGRRVRPEDARVWGAAAAAAPGDA